MSKAGAVIEASSFCLGVNTYPSVMNRQERLSFMSRAINRSTYRLLNETRPPFREVFLRFESSEDEFIFRNAGLSGLKAYEGEYPLFSSFIIASVGDRIFAGYIRGNSIDFIKIYQGINPDYHFAFYCQALNILTYNDGKNPGLFWSGDPAFPMKPIYQSAYVGDTPMPVSNLCVFAFGRFFPCTEQNLVYAGDYMYAKGDDLSLAAREKVLSFKETTYPSSGDGFGAPAAMGPITGIVAVPQSNTLNGFGDIWIVCRNGVFSISPNRKVRNEWTMDPEMQKFIFTGKGCAAPNSLCVFNNQIFYRDCSTEISSLNLDIARYQSLQGFTAISREVDHYTAYDRNLDNIQHTCSGSTDSRMLVSVSHRKELSTEMGAHRYGEGMISSCIQKTESGPRMAWEGLWTGIRPTGMAVTTVGNTKKLYISSFDHDKQNRIYLLEEGMRGDDILLAENRRIKSKFSFSSLFSDIGEQTAIIQKQLRRAEVLILNGLKPGLTFSFSRGGEYKRFNVDIPLTESSGCNYSAFRGLSREAPPAENTGYFFNAHFEMEGYGQVAKVVFSADSKNISGHEETKCIVQESPGFNICEWGKDCDRKENDFEYQLHPLILTV